MKTLILVRHAKTKEHSSDGVDFNRVLTSRGKSEAEQRAIQLQALRPSPDFILCSNAVRARQTAECINSLLRLPAAAIRYEDELYLASEHQLSEMVQGVTDRCVCLVVIAHNPGLIHFVNYLSPQTIHSLPTSAAVQVSLSIDSWSELGEGSGVVQTILLPER